MKSKKLSRENMFKLPFFGRFLKGDQHRNPSIPDNARLKPPGISSSLTGMSLLHFNYVRNSATPKTKIKTYKGLQYNTKADCKRIRKDFVRGMRNGN